MTTTTKAREFKRAPRNLSQEESEVVSVYAMVAMLETEEEKEGLLVLRMETRMTTRNMQIETGATIRMISSPRESRRVGVGGVGGVWGCAIQLWIEGRGCRFSGFQFLLFSFGEVSERLSEQAMDRNLRLWVNFPVLSVHAPTLLST